jgi:hypothetical protein
LDVVQLANGAEVRPLAERRLETFDRLDCLSLDHPTAWVVEQVAASGKSTDALEEYFARQGNQAALAMAAARQ